MDFTEYTYKGIAIQQGKLLGPDTAVIILDNFMKLKVSVHKDLEPRDAPAKDTGSEVTDRDAPSDNAAGGVTPADHQEPPPVAADDLTAIIGIGTTTAERLARAGITSYAALAEAETKAVAQAAKTNETIAAQWQKDAALGMKQ